MRPMSAGWNSERYDLRMEGVSRAGSQVMKIGRIGVDFEVEAEDGEAEAAREIDGKVEVEAEGSIDEVKDREPARRALRRSSMAAILSSSSGQISGQCVKPK